MATTPSVELSGNVVMYGRPEPLTLEAHGGLGVNPSMTPFSFAKSTNAVPLQVTEFGVAALSYPIIFAGDEFLPLAVMSVRQNANLFISEEGAFDVDAYVPAFIRRYPFVLANNGGDDQMVVCIDRDASSLVEGGEVALFDNGKPSTFTEQALKFCGDLETERRRTEQFVARLRALDLFQSTNATFTPRQPDGSMGAPIQLADYFAISEEKLAKLPPEVILELNDSGALRQIHAHIISLANWERLVNRTTARYGGSVAGTA